MCNHSAAKQITDDQQAFIDGLPDDALAFADLTWASHRDEPWTDAMGEYLAQVRDRRARMRHAAMPLDPTASERPMPLTTLLQLRGD